MIKWNEYTWYSKLAAIVFFLLVFPVWTFFLGTEYQKTKDALDPVSVLPLQISEKTPIQTPSFNQKIEEDVKNYVSAHLSELSSEKEVLGGTFYVTDIRAITVKVGDAQEVQGDVTYEDGHNAYKAHFIFGVNKDNTTTLKTFEIAK